MFHRSAPRSAARFLALTFAAAASVAFFAGCASNRTYVLQPIMQPTAIARPASVSVKALDPFVEVSPEDRAHFETDLAVMLKQIYGASPSQGGDVVLNYRFVLNDKGNAAYRVGSNVLNLVGSPFYGFGDGNIGVEVVYTRRDGTRLAHIVVDGTLSGAFGNTESAISEATTSIARFTQEHFGTTQPAKAKAADSSSMK